MAPSREVAPRPALAAGPLEGAGQSAPEPRGGGPSGGPPSSGAPLRDLVAELAPASPELLAERALLRRTDTKFLVPERLVEPFLRRLASEYAIATGDAGPVCTYQTRYFDTPDLRSFHDHRRGRRLRQKVRVRDYLERSASFLEVKSRKSDILTLKDRLSRPPGGATLSERELAFVAENCRYPAGELVPSARVDYRRATLVARDAPERVTLDVDLAVGPSGGGEEAAEALRGVAIVEIKQRAFSVTTGAMRALKALGLRWLSVSKYCAAVALTREGVRCNRFLPALRKIERMRT